MKKSAFENFASFTRKHLCQSLFFNKVVLLYWDYFHSVPHSHCVKSFQIRSAFWSTFSCIRTEYGDRKSPYSVQILKNKDQK